MKNKEQSFSSHKIYTTVKDYVLCLYFGPCETSGVTNAIGILVLLYTVAEDFQVEFLRVH